MIDFESKTYSKILKSQMDRIPDSLDKREGSIIQTALGPASWYLEGVYLDMAFILNSIYADTACGKYLDRIASQNNIERKPAAYAERKGIFDIKIPTGSRFSTVNADMYVTYVAEEFLAQTGTGYAYQMRCEEPGSIGNDYSGQLIAIDYIAGLTQANLTDIIREGSEEETDEALRARILTKTKLPSTSGNKYDYYNWAMECEGVGAAKIFPLANGPGTVKVVITSSEQAAAGDSLVELVRNYIEERRPIGAAVSVISAVEKEISITAKVKLKNGVNLGTAQELFLSEFTNFLRGGAFDLAYVSLARTGNLLLNTAGVEDFSDLTLNGQSKNIELTDEEIAVAGSVVLEVM